MTEPIEDVGSLPGRKIVDQADNAVGKVTDVYATGDGYPMWVALDVSIGLAGKRTAFVPLARLKDEGGQVRVPYSKQRIAAAPAVGGGDVISSDCDRRLRDHYGIDAGAHDDQDLADGSEN